MSWLFSQALVEEFLAGNSLDGEQSVQLNGNPTQLAYCAPDKMTDFSRLSRFGMTYKPLTENRGEELLTLFRAGFHAKTFQQQEKAQELTENDQECGDTWRGWLAKYDPNTSSWRTAQCSLLEDLNECLETLPRWGMTRNGLLWEQPMLEPITKETEFGSLENWPTPDANCGKRGTQPNWTPKRKSGQPAQYTINQAVRDRMFPAPRAFMHKDSTTDRGKHNLGEVVGGKLNPTWVEWLMGWPLEWTDLKPLVMDKCHFVPQQHGNS